MAKLMKTQRDAIEKNKREGLLCACNAVRVPYYGNGPGGHGTLLLRGTLHGYDDCVPPRCTSKHEGCDLSVGASLQVGTKVQIRKHGADETFPAQYAGRRGTIVGFVTGYQGACEHMPAYRVRFANGEVDTFWIEELS